MLRNVMEEAVRQRLDAIVDHPETLGDVQMACTCERCRQDVLAIALNSLPPKYTVAPRGELFAKAAMFNLQYDVDIFKALMAAIRQVSEKPHHSAD